MPFETIYVETAKVACEGNGADSGHPKVYLSLANTGETVCPYCSRKFINKNFEKPEVTA